MTDIYADLKQKAYLVLANHHLMGWERFCDQSA
jgi:hypothetical protein